MISMPAGKHAAAPCAEPRIAIARHRFRAHECQHLCERAGCWSSRAGAFSPPSALRSGDDPEHYRYALVLHFVSQLIARRSFGKPISERYLAGHTQLTMHIDVDGSLEDIIFAPEDDFDLVSKVFVLKHAGRLGVQLEVLGEGCNANNFSRCDFGADTDARRMSAAIASKMQTLIAERDANATHNRPWWPPA